MRIESEIDTEHIEQLRQMVTTPNTRFFNAYMRVCGRSVAELLSVKCEMEKIGCKPSPATLLALYSQFDHYHRRIMIEQIESSPNLVMSPSDDFFDFTVFSGMTKKLMMESAKLSKFKLG